MTAVLARAEAVADQTFDVAAIGAGPAGLLAAHQAAAAGLRTLIIERKTWPRTKVCGGCLNERGVAALAAAGLAHVLEEAGAQPLERVEMRSGGRRVALDLPPGVVIARDRFDAALAAAAQRAGARLLVRTTAHVEPHDPAENPAENPAPDPAPLRVVRLSQPGRPCVYIRAAVVLVCDGLAGGSVADLPEFQQHVSGSSRVGLGARIPCTGCDRDAPFPPGVVSLHVGQAGYVGTVRLGRGWLNLAAALDRQALQNMKPAAAVAYILEQAGVQSPAGLEKAPWRGVPALTRRTRPSAARRVFLLGDAAGYVEPFTGEGMAGALTDALAVVPLATGAAEAWDDAFLGQWDQVHQRQMLRRERSGRLLAGLLRRPTCVRAAGALLETFPRLAAPLVDYCCAWGAAAPAEST